MNQSETRTIILDGGTGTMLQARGMKAGEDSTAFALAHLDVVEDVARHSETDEEMVVYRKLYGDGSLWVRPKDMFLAEVDRAKYPDATQRYRFELQDIPSVAHR